MAHEVLCLGTVLVRRSRRQNPRSRGFTLIELSIVVAIVGILAVIAVVGYRKYTLYTKITEAQGNISGIKIAQEDYRAEKGVYLNIGTSTTWCPAAAGVSDKKVGWDSQCGAGAAKWEQLPVHIDGVVQFQYQTLAGPSAFDGSSVSFVNWTGANANVPWFLVHARCDLDGQGAPDTQLATSSFSNQIFSDAEGQ